jgi:hypothetical protein
MNDFWDNHGYWFIFFIMFFPRLTLLFATTWGGFLWWVGWVLAPEITVAILATIHYSETNIALVVFSWLWAFFVIDSRRSKRH